MNKSGEFKKRVWLGSLKRGDSFRIVNGYHKVGINTFYEIVDFITSSYGEIVVTRICKSNHKYVGTLKYFDPITYVWI